MKSRLRQCWWLLLLIPIVIGFARLRFDADILNLLPGELPVVQGLKTYQNHFADSQGLIVTIRSSDPEIAEMAARSLAEALRAQPSLVRSAVWQQPWRENPASSAELLAYLWLNQPPDVFAQMKSRLAPENLENVLSATRERLATTFSPHDLARLANDPFDLMQIPGSLSENGLDLNEKMFASEDGTFRLIQVQPASERMNYRQNASWLQNIKNTAANWRTNNDAFASVETRFTGGPVFAAEIGTGMEKDLTGPSLGTLAVIALLFYFTYRRWLPLLWLIFLLVIIFALTLALAGVAFGTLNVVSLGFASILFGLAEDFGIVLYHEARSHPQLSAKEIHRLARPGIFWSALTTCGAFLLLNLGGLPGLSQLGTLVSIGIAVAAMVMLGAYLPLLLGRSPQPVPVIASEPKSASHLNQAKSRWIAFATLALTAAGIFLLWNEPPPFDRSPAALRPKQSEAYDTLTEIRTALAQDNEPAWLTIEGRTEEEIFQTLEQITPIFENAVSNRTLERFVFPTVLWPRADFQKANLDAARALASQYDALVAAALASGFTQDALVLTENMLATWAHAANSPTVFWPTNENSRWVLEKVAAQTGDGFAALGLLHLASPDFAKLSWLKAQLPSNVNISSWELLGPEMSRLVLDRLTKVLLPILILVIITLWLAFRSIAEVFLSLATLAFSSLALLLLMKLLGWSWNMMNLMALPLLFGLGVDFSIHMQLTLRRSASAHRAIGHALLLAGTTTVAGFASLIFSSNAGLASLGKICATGIACTLLTAVFFLPAWWLALGGNKNTSSPSSLYRGGLWSFGIVLSRILPRPFSAFLARLGGLIYYLAARHRRLVVIKNLLPVLKNNPSAARPQTRQLFQNFAGKLLDLWRFEAGVEKEIQFSELTGWNHFVSARARGQGVLLITPHLGNWEFGGPLMRRHGIDLYVVTLPEPDDITAQRQKVRARLGIKTIVVGEDPFSFVEIIKRLHEGATVAILIDRPPEPATVKVELFGKKFNASISAAELARASGCAIVPVILPRVANGYAARVLPEITYERAKLNTAESRRQFTEQIMRVFEPAISQYADQWYHFVPVWSE